MSRLMTYFARGCLALVPIAATVYVAYHLVTGLDRLFGVPIVGLGIVLALSLITLTGALLSNVLGRQLLWLVDAIFSRLPIAKVIYTSVRDLMNAFSGANAEVGQAVTFRPFPNSELRQLGFLTRSGLPALTLPDHAAVFIPQAYGLGGQVLLVPKSSIEPLALSSKELLTFAISGGAAGLGERAAAP